MKLIIQKFYSAYIVMILSFLVLIPDNANAQFWTEDFVPVNGNANGFANGYIGANAGTWTVTTLPGNNTSGVANVWYISCQEASVLPDYCGGTCLGVPSPSTPLIGQSLHISSGIVGDVGGLYMETGSSQTDTELRVESPAIDCSGQSGLILSFNYIEFGDGLNDNAQVWYFDGLTWSMLSDMPKTMCGDASGTCNPIVCNGLSQGYWTAYSVALPASADNNPNVKIGFYWKNIDDGTATDPSVAVGRIQIGNGTTTDNSEINTYSKNKDALIAQNLPNPFNYRTLINYHIPANSKNAHLLIYDAWGMLIQSVKLKSVNKGSVEILTDDFKAGVYHYSLIVDNELIETKKMVKLK